MVVLFNFLLTLALISHFDRGSLINFRLPLPLRLRLCRFVFVFFSTLCLKANNTFLFLLYSCEQAFFILYFFYFTLLAFIWQTFHFHSLTSLFLNFLSWCFAFGTYIARCCLFDYLGTLRSHWRSGCDEWLVCWLNEWMGGHQQVSWIRKRDLHILTVATATYTSDKRFQVSAHDSHQLESYLTLV